MLRSIFVLLIMVPGLVAAVFDRYAALLLYVWYAMFRPQDWLWIDISPFRPSLLIGAALVIPSVFTGVFPVVFHPLAVGSLLFLGSSLLAQLGAVQPAVGWQWVYYLARLLLVSLLIAPLVTTPRRILIFTGVLSGSLLFHSAKAGLSSLLTGGTQYSAGLAGAFVDNNGYALATAMAMFLFIGVAQNVRWRPIRWAMYVVAGPLSAMTIVSLFSRGGLLALIAGTLVFVLLQRWWRAAAAFVIVALCASFLRSYLPTGYVRRVSTLTSYQQVMADRSAEGRLHFWLVAVEMAAARPLGVGLGNFEYAYDGFDFSNGFYGHNRSVHNSYLQVLTEAGFIGMAMYVFVMIWMLRILFRIRRRARDAALPSDMRELSHTLATALIASVAAFLIGGTFISAALNDLTWLTVGTVIALDRLTAVSTSVGGKSALRGDITGVPPKRRQFVAHPA